MQKAIVALEYLSSNLLEKLRVLNNNNCLIVSSGYRCTRLNKAIGGVSSSQHQKGEAAAINFVSIASNKEF